MSFQNGTWIRHNAKVSLATALLTLTWADKVAATPFSMMVFCANNPNECRAEATASIPLTEELLQVLHQINKSVNRAIRPASETRDTWEIQPPAGDCDDYVVTKRSRLMALGVPAGVLRLAATTTRTGRSHLVLLVRTSRGDLILDNLTNEIVTLSQSGYQVSTMSTRDPKQWM